MSLLGDMLDSGNSYSRKVMVLTALAALVEGGVNEGEHAMVIKALSSRSVQSSCGQVLHRRYFGDVQEVLLR